ncbi:MAG TPA: N-6 DNA methylase, partial [Anaerolineaceae bacterium]|nr:N-6 DNA methylase [Anaerolineaceae bacterium]
MVNWKLEENVDQWVVSQLVKVGLVQGVNFNSKNTGSYELKHALSGASKTIKRTGEGQPDYHIEKYVKNGCLVLIENKLKHSKLVAKQGDLLKMDDNSVASYAVNGAVYYAQSVIASGKYDEVIAIGVAGDNAENVEIQTYYVHSKNLQPKLLSNVKTMDFLGREDTFQNVLREAKLTDVERHRILINSKAELNKKAKELNKLMNNHSINVEQRVIYVSGCLLAMQEVYNDEGTIIHTGLTPDALKGAQGSQSDGKLITGAIGSFLTAKEVSLKNAKLLQSTFDNSIANDPDRDIPIALDKLLAKLLKTSSSLNKQVFTFIYENIFLTIDATGGHLDVMGEMYSEFLKYAFGDGKDIGIVLTPPYVTNMMVNILGINRDSKVMDLATGSGGFLISGMTRMIEDAEKAYGKGTDRANSKIEEIKANQLLGVELDSKMFALAMTNMFLRGDSSTLIEKGSSFDRPEKLYKDFNADRLLLNPPFSYEGNGMPFIEFGLNHMQKHGVAAIIVQDSAGSGRASAINQRILSKHTLMASIKMPNDLFQPSAGVQTSIYVFEAGVPHDKDKTVNFIDFRNDGYKRTGRGLSEIDNATKRYQDIIHIYKSGTDAIKHNNFHKELWDLSSIFVRDYIDPTSGSDWNFEQHQIINTIPVEKDFLNTVRDYISWELLQLLTENHNIKGKTDTELCSQVKWSDRKLKEIFTIHNTNKKYNANNVTIYPDKSQGLHPYVVRTEQNNGIRGYIEGDLSGLNPKNSISFGQDTFTCFYQPDSYFTGD